MTIVITVDLKKTPKKQQPDIIKILPKTSQIIIFQTYLPQQVPLNIPVFLFHLFPKR